MLDFQDLKVVENHISKYYSFEIFETIVCVVVSILQIQMIQKMLSGSSIVWNKWLICAFLFMIKKLKIDIYEMDIYKIDIRKQLFIKNLSFLNNFTLNFFLQNLLFYFHFKILNLINILHQLIKLRFPAPKKLLYLFLILFNPLNQLSFSFRLFLKLLLF